MVTLPKPGVPNGRSLFLRLASGETVSIPASAKSGWTVLARSLRAERVQPGDRLALRFDGWRNSTGGEHRYRVARVIVLDRPIGRAA